LLKILLMTVLWCLACSLAAFAVALGAFLLGATEVETPAKIVGFAVAITAAGAFYVMIIWFVGDIIHCSPELGRQVIAWAFGDIYARPGLPPRDRQLVTLGMLTALGGCEPQLEVHINAALNIGITPGRSLRRCCTRPSTAACPAP
jgi:hypothetical protein